MFSSLSRLRISPFLALTMVLATALFFAASQPADAADFTVTKTADSNDGTCNADCSLREAITAAEAAGGADTVLFDTGVFPPGAPATIAVGSGLPTSFDTTIDGTGAGVIVDGIGAPGATGFNFNSGGVLTDATVRNVTIRNFSDTGINMNAGTDNNGATIDGVVLEDNGDGINVNAGNNTNAVAITNSTVTNSDGYGINVNSGNDNSGSSISGSTVSNSNGNGININAGGDNINAAVSNSTVSGGADGGVVLNAGFSGDVTGASISGSTISGNNGGVEVFGGNGSPPGLTVSNSTISGNTTTNDGGGVRTDVDTVITGSTISGNTGDDGGGIEAGAILAITNSTISGNTALVDGGGISSSAPAGSSTLFLTNVTIVGNTAQSFDTGGGIQVRGTADVLNTIIANNTDQGGFAPDCDGDVNSLGNNLIEDVTGCNITGDTAGNITGTDPNLGALADNGGPTSTHAVSPGTPPHNAGRNAGCPATDQRGVARPQEGTCEIGAYEFQVVTPAPTGTPTQAPAALPPTGGPAGDGASQAWLIALAVLGLAAVAGIGTFAVAKRS